MTGAVLEEKAWRVSPGRGLNGDIGCCMFDDARELRKPLTAGFIPRSRWRLRAIELWDAFLLPAYGDGAPLICMLVKPLLTWLPRLLRRDS